MNPAVIFIALLIIACKSSPTRTETPQATASTRLSPESLSDLIVKYSGRTFTNCPGEFKKEKAFVLFIDKHNWPYRDSITTAELEKHKLSATGTADLNTVVLVYANNMPLDDLIGQQKPPANTPGYHICFIDNDSMCIKKTVHLSCDYNNPDKYKLIAEKIIETF